MTHPPKPPRRLQRLTAILVVFMTALAPGFSLGAGSAPAHASPEIPAKAKGTGGPPAGDYPQMVIGPGDLLTIFVYGENGLVGGGGSAGELNQLPTDYQVDSDGVIEFPFLGPVNLTGLTPVKAGEKIARLLSKPRKVTVLIRQSSTFWVSVLGNVPKPGRFQIQGRPTLLSALSEAGGPLPDTDLGGTILIHGQAKSRLDLNLYLKDTGVREKDPYLYPGDTLLVQRSSWPTTGEWAIIASILASGTIIAVELNNLHH